MLNDLLRSNLTRSTKPGVRLSGKREDYEHNHGETTGVYLDGYCDTAPTYHVFKCKAPSCPWTSITHCPAVSGVNLNMPANRQRECTVCHKR